MDKTLVMYKDNNKCNNGTKEIALVTLPQLQILFKDAHVSIYPIILKLYSVMLLGLRRLESNASMDDDSFW